MIKFVFYFSLFSINCFLVGCLPSSKPFVKFEEIPSEKLFPDYSLTDSIKQTPAISRDTAYVNALVRDQRVNEALYYCNSYLLENPNGSLSNYFRFKRFNIQFLQQFIGHYSITPVAEYDIVAPRINLCGKSISKTLSAYFEKIGIVSCSADVDTLFMSIGYPTQSDVRYVVNLVKSAKERLDSLNIDTNQLSLSSEKLLMMNFLNDFEPEIVKLGVWKYIQNGAWDSASAYCVFMAPKYPKLGNYFKDIEASIISRPKIIEKSKVISGILSGILPGSGQFYNNKYSDGLLWFIGLGIQATAAGYLLNDVNYKKDKAELVWGAVFSLTSIITYISNINTAIENTGDSNKEINLKEIDLYINSLKVLPPGMKDKKK